MTTRNFRVNNGLSVGDIVISASANTITGGATAAPNADGQFANKKFVDDSIAAISTAAISQGNSNATITDSGTGVFTVSADGTESLSVAAAATTITATGAINLSPGTDVVIPANKGITFGSGEKIEGDSTDLTVTSGGKINLTATTDVHIPNAVGLKFGDGGEHIETDNTDFTVTSGGKINLATASDVHLANNKGMVFGDAGEKIEGDGTDLTIASSGVLNLTATGNTAITNNATIGGNLVLTGNLTVNGDTTTVNTSNTTIADNLIELNTGISASSNDAGLIIERGSTGNNAAIIWDESADKFTMGLTTATAADKSGGISLSGVSTLVANLEGAVTGDVTGNADTATALASAVNIGGVSFDGSGAINLPGVNQAGNQNTSGTAAVATAVTAADESSDTACNVLFVTAATGDLGPKTGTNLTFNSSAGTLTTTTFVGDLTGTATAAEYSDVAERFASDTAYEAGTVVALGGAEEITQVNEEGSDEVFGVISSLSQAAFKMNGGAGNDATHPYIAMTGRVNVKVIGSVSKGDRLISASVPGYAKAAIKSECTAFNVIGRALTSKTELGNGTVLAAVRVSH